MVSPLGFTTTVTGIIEGVANIILVIGWVKKIEHDQVNKYGDDLVALEKEMCPVFTGELRDSITKREVNAETVEIGPTAPYALWVEDGSAPHTPPTGALAAWASAKGMSESEIVSKIEERGTLAHPFVKPAVERLQARGTLIGVTMVTGPL